MIRNSRIKPTKVYATSVAKKPKKPREKQQRKVEVVQPEDDSFILPNYPTPEPSQIALEQAITQIVINDDIAKDSVTTDERRVTRAPSFCVIYTFMSLLMLFCIINAFLTLYLYRSCGCQQANEFSKANRTAKDVIVTINELEKEVVEVKKTTEYFKSSQRGEPGPQGLVGPPGPPGPPGNTGQQGLPGRQGIPGSTGFKGSRGDKGSSGAAGPQGVQGIQGPPGGNGSQGIPGTKGEPGVIGPRGLQGLMGIQGPAGYNGTQGIPGPPGRPGSDRTPGDPGPPGPPGPKGDIGTANFSLCKHLTESSTTHANNGNAADTTALLLPHQLPGWKITGVTCTTLYGKEVEFYTEVDPVSGRKVYVCHCKGRSSLFVSGVQKGMKCVIHYWICPIIT